MAEGAEHKDNVKKLYNYICGIVPSGNLRLIIVDNEGFSNPNPIFEGVIPDVSYYHKDVMILGEAKSMKDFDRPHSLRQYKAYVETCESFDGESTFILLVHWDTFLSAQKIIRRMLPENYKGEYIIISSNGKVAKL